MLPRQAAFVFSFVREETTLSLSLTGFTRCATCGQNTPRWLLCLSAAAPFDWVEQIKPQKNLARSYSIRGHHSNLLYVFLLKGLCCTQPSCYVIYLQGAVLYCTSHSLINKDDDESPDMTVLRAHRVLRDADEESQMLWFTQRCLHARHWKSPPAMWDTVSLCTATGSLSLRRKVQSSDCYSFYSFF
jgi:hypothetical protein